MSKQKNSHSKRRGRRSAAAKLLILFEDYSLLEEQLGNLLRREGINGEDLAEWRSKATGALQDGKRKKSEKTPEAIKIRDLKRELVRKEKAMADAAALLVPKKNVSRILRGRGRKHSAEERRMILDGIHVARQAGSRQCAICAELDISQRLIQRWRNSKTGADGRHGPNIRPANKFSRRKRNKILKVPNSRRFRGLPPCQIVAILADEEVYIASESTMSRILRDAKMNKNRGRAKEPANRFRPRAIKTTAPNQCWTWDITHLKSDLKGLFFHGYVAIDVIGRNIVAAAVHDSESTDFAAHGLQQACSREGIEEDQLIIHADIGAPTKGATLAATLKDLGVSKSISRPSVSNDNAISEAALRTMKYRPNYPNGHFESLAAAKNWIGEFVAFYNNPHRHSAIKFVTPNLRHEGLDRDILQKRKKLYERQKRKQPQHWGTRETKDWFYNDSVILEKRMDAEQKAA